MIYIYGDSHSDHSFRNLQHKHKNLNASSVTMFRIGRDNIIVNFDKNMIKKNDTIVLSYGEVDCRCHVKRQMNLGREEDTIIRELVYNYFRTINNNVKYKGVNVIIVGVIAPTKRNDYESLHGPITHQFPFVGTDEERVRFTAKVNKLFEELSIQYGYHYFNPYTEYYTRPDGTFKFELSDNNVHLRDNRIFLEKFNELYANISCLVDGSAGSANASTCANGADNGVNGVCAAPYGSACSAGSANASNASDNRFRMLRRLCFLRR